MRAALLCLVISILSSGCGAVNSAAHSLHVHASNTVGEVTLASGFIISSLTNVVPHIDLNVDKP